MKRILCILLTAVIMISLCSCSKQELEDMSTKIHDDHTDIVWGHKTYVPYCPISTTDCGEQIGIVDGNKDDRVYAYKGHPADEWIVNVYHSHLMDGAMLYREIGVIDIPDGLQSEYEWNSSM